MLTFVGLGLYDERSITVAGRDAIAAADRVVIERYTSHLAGASVADLEAFHDCEIEPRDRASVERTPDDLLDAAATDHVVFLTGGDPMISTTHVDLRLRAADRGIETAIVHGPSASSAASSLTGLQNYRFGKATTVPFPDTVGPGIPNSVIDTIQANRERGLHTLAYLDIDGAAGQYLDAAVAAGYLTDPLADSIGVVVARAGSHDPLVRADSLSRLSTMDFGSPLHLLVIPGSLHDLEREALTTFAALPGESLVDESVPPGDDPTPVDDDG